MRSLSQIILLLTLSVGLHAQSPHGKEFVMACADCHNPKGWKLEAGTYSFTHNTTRFPLVGMHQDVNCKLCHTSLIFSEAKSECVSCHADMHYQTVGMECERCHTPQSWLVENINEIHRQSRFPLVGAHITADCYSCHPSASLLRFEPLGVECIDCHRQDYESTTSPNHVQGNYSTECLDCHKMNAFTWSSSDINHSFFPLTEGHALNDCQLCHTGTDYSNISSECYSCHQTDYSSTANPNHSTANFPTNCTECHTTHPGWKPTTWNHSNFPLTQGHDIDNCIECHQDPNNYSNVPVECFGCHEADYNSSSNPGHLSANFSTNCTECHTTHPDWKPANFQAHDAQYFPIYSGKHAGTWDNCSDCHTNPGNYAANSCIICHNNQAELNDEHNEVGGYAFNDAACFECHPTGEAEGGFNHNLSNFPLTGAHISTECLECHSNGYAGTTTICGDCHVDDYNQSTNPNHIVAGISNDCAACHTTDPDWKPATFAVHNDYYLLSGAHASIAGDCFSCHAGDYNNTPNICFGCHADNYNQTTNPNHITIGISNDCETCHTTNSEWKPASFPTHSNYYALIGAHATIATDCFTCHNDNYVNTPNTCFGCHATDYNQSTNPDHQAAQFPTDCESCHTQTAWEPSTFNHDGQYFPIYSGAHNGKWDQCLDCHTNPSNYAIFTCITCHQQGETNSEHQGISGYQYNSDACLACHPDGSGNGAFNHNGTNFPLTGAHSTVECSLCHVNGYGGTSTICNDCHDDDYNQSTNPNHNTLGLSDDCETCHTTNPNWQPATFPVHNSFYVLAGAHVAISNDCIICHNGNYNNTPNTCYGCHASDYNQTNNPPHLTAQFPTDCEMCHTQSVWDPSTFNHDGQYFPIYSGHHQGEWNQCSDCHTNPGNYEIFTCLTCHSQPEMDDEHSDVSGYQYNSNACLACHPDGGNSKTLFDQFKKD
jgi:hypothetical protein